MRAKVNPKPLACNGSGRTGSTEERSASSGQVEASKDRSRQRRQSEGHETILVPSGANAVHPKPSEAKPEGEKRTEQVSNRSTPKTTAQRKSLNHRSRQHQHTYPRITPELSRPAKRVRLGRLVMRAKVNPKPLACNGSGRTGSTEERSASSGQVEASKDRSRQRRQSEGHETILVPSGANAVHPKPSEAKPEGEKRTEQVSNRSTPKTTAQRKSLNHRSRQHQHTYPRITPELSRPAKRVRLGRLVMRAKVNPKPLACNGSGRTGSTEERSASSGQVEASKDRSRQRRQSEGHETILVPSGANAVHPKPSEAKPEGESEPNRSVTDQRRRQRRNVSR